MTLNTRQRIFDIVLVVVMASLCTGIVALLWQQPWILAVAIIPFPLVLAHRLGKWKFALWLMLYSALAGAVTEYFCSLNGLWTYHNTGGLPIIPPWLVVGWANFALAFYLVVRGLLGRFPKIGAKPGIIVWSALAITIEIILYTWAKDSTPTALGVGLFFVVLLSLFIRSPELFIVLIAGMALGPMMEAIPISVGAWSYPYAHILGMPVWMLLAYGVFAVLVTWGAGALARILTRE